MEPRRSALKPAFKAASVATVVVLLLVSGLWFGTGTPAKHAFVMVPFYCALVCVPSGTVAVVIGLLVRLWPRNPYIAEFTVLLGTSLIGLGLVLAGIGHGVASRYGPDYHYPG